MIAKAFRTTLVLLLLLVISLASYGYVLYRDIVTNEPLPSKIEQIRSQENYVPTEDISPDFLNAIYSIEDRRFYKHGAIDSIALMRASIRNIQKKKLREGGSSITQQLAKNMYFDHSRSLSRKLAEFYLAHELERILTKDEILELYVNIIYYGDGYYGISDASYGYFKKKPKDLNLNESSLLAAVPNAPSLLSLSKNYSGAQKRQREVLEAMLDTKTISKEEFERLTK